MKKKFAIMVIFIISTLLCSYVFAESLGEIAVSEITIKQGTEKAEIYLSLKDNPGIASAKMTLNFDDSIMKLTDVIDMGLLGTAVHSPVLESPYTLYWNNGTVKDNFEVNDAVVKFTFQINENAQPGKYPISVSCDTDDILNVDMDNVEFITKDGGIIITSSDKSKDTSTNSHSGKTTSSNSQKSENTDYKDTTSPVQNNQIILTIDNKEATVFGKTVVNDVSPIIRNDRTMLPARFVAENLGARVEWFAAEQKVKISSDNIEILLLINSDNAVVNGENIQLDSAAFIENDRTYTPVRFIAEKLGAKVEWNEGSRTVLITK